MSLALTTAASSLEDEIKSLFGGGPTISASHFADLRKSAENLERDPQFHSEFLKGKFVTAIVGAMEELGLNQTEVARKWGRSRQYLSKLLNEDKRVNFTFDTAVELAMIVNRKFDIVLVDMEESAFVMRCSKLPERDVTPSKFTEEDRTAPPTAQITVGDRAVITRFPCHQYESDWTNADGAYDASTQLSA